MFEKIKRFWRDKREWRFLREKITRGFSEKETWCLDHTIAKFVLPRLKYFREVRGGCPGCFNKPKEWYIILDKMIFAMEKIAIDDDFPDKHEDNKIQEGCKLFGKWFQCLWW